MTKEEMKNKISMALKDPILQQGFEIICKENAELNDKLNNLSKVAEVRLANWQKYEQENAELKAQIEKMKDCLNKWYKQHNDDDYTETFYDNLLRDTEKCLWGYSVND